MTSTPQSQSDSSDGDDASSPLQSQQSEHNDNPSPSIGASSQPPKPTISMHKRRRVTRACDECRRKKIKCDGKNPCTHCTVYTYVCSYDQPSNRRRNPAPQYVEALEHRLQRAEAILRNALPDVDLDDPAFEVGLPQRMHPSLPQRIQPNNIAQGRPLGLPGRPQQPDGEKDYMLESMVENTGSLDLDDEGYWDFHGHSSGRAFLRKMRDQFGDLMGQPEGYVLPFVKNKGSSQTFNSPISSASSPISSKSPNTYDLPPKDCAQLLCKNALDDACALLRFVHQPTFYAMFHRVYESRPEELGTQEIRFIPLLYSTIALGTLFATNQRSELQRHGFPNAIEQGYHWFRASRQMMDITDCRDLTSLQTVLFMVLFLQSSARLSNCYSHLGIVLRSAMRMGLHRSVSNTFNPIEQETRRRVFWCVRKLDTYVGALLGLPKTLSDEDIDQEMPLEVDDEYITAEKVLPMPPGKVSLMASFNAHTRLVVILSKTVQYIYPIKGNKGQNSQSYIVSHARIREIEQDLQQWMEALPMAFRPGDEAPPEFVRIQQLLRMAYAHLEMFLYRPFLHYVSQDIQAKGFDKRSYACAAACVSVSRNTIHITAEMKRRQLLQGSYWFYMYTTFFAVISLVFYVLENPQSITSADILRDAHEGKDTLAGLAANSLAADLCSRMLKDLFVQLAEKLKGVRMNSVSHKKRSAPPHVVTQPQLLQSAPEVTLKANAHGGIDVRRANSSPIHQSTWKPSTNPSEQPSLQHQTPQDLSTDFVRGTQDLYKPSNPTSSGLQTPSSPSKSAAPYNPLNPPTSNSLLDLSAMMFPSADPFAYPIQPMTTLENHQYIKEEIPNPHLSHQDVYDLTSTFATSSSFENNLDGGIHNSMPPEFVQGQQGDFGLPPMASPMGMNGPDPQQRMMTMQESEGTGWQQQVQGQRAPGMNFDQLFGEDWGGWMHQGYRQ